MNSFLSNEFIFSNRYRVWRHIIYWSFHITAWAVFWIIMGVPLSFGRQLLNMIMWVPVFILYGYPLVYGAIPHLLLKGKLLQFFLVILAWGAAGLYIDAAYRSYILIPVQEAMRLDNILPRGPLAFCYLCMTTSAASAMIIKFYKLWTLKQQAWMHAQQEKIATELQLLKAQIHPNFLLNSLNNIYSFSMKGSSKTPGLILKLSTLLSYMLYDCKTEEVRLEKELAIMKNYIALEQERYNNKIDVSWNVEGEAEDKFIAPLLMLPFIENAFKHGVSGQIKKSWLSVDISIKQDSLQCKIANSKSEYVKFSDGGTGIANVKKRLDFIYPGKHELRLNDEGNFFVIALLVNFTAEFSGSVSYPETSFVTQVA